MGSTQKKLSAVLWAALVLSMLGVVGAGIWVSGKDDAGHGGVVHGANDGTPVLFDAPAFSLTDQDGKPFTQNDLAGKVWVADLIFTTCGSICPMMTSEMTKLQGQISDGRVQLVSFSVDPKRDTPEVLKKYAAKFKADETRWHFLTGDTDAVAKGLKLVAEPAQGETPILHSNRFLLVDAAGKVRGVYDSTDAAAMTKLVADATSLAAAAGSVSK